MSTIYNFEHPVQKAFALAIGAQSIAIYTPSNDGFVDDAWKLANPNLAAYVLPFVVSQKERPRIELMVKIGAAQGRHFAESTSIPPVGGYSHDFARAISVGLKVITASNIILHYEYLATIRYVMATILRAVNGDLTPDVAGPEGSQLTNHRIAALDEAGSSNAYKADDGVFITDIVYNGHITVQADAFEAL